MAKTPIELEGMVMAIGVGSALSAWSAFEVRLTHLFATLSDMPDEAKAWSIFDNIISFEVRLVLCDRLMQFEDCGPLEKEIWKAFRTRAGKEYKKRHEVAHFSVVEKTEGDKKTVYLSPFLSHTKLLENKAVLLTAADLKKRADGFGELMEAIVWFWAGARKRRGLRSEPLPPDPPLIAHIRALAARNRKAPL